MDYAEHFGWISMGVTATSEELSAQAQTLQMLVSKFKLENM